MTRNDLLTFDGITQSVWEWALDYGIPSKTITTRLAKGMSIEQAITKPIRTKPGVTLDDLDPTRYRVRGVDRDLPESVGTGVGSVVQETSNIKISK